MIVSITGEVCWMMNAMEKRKERGIGSTRGVVPLNRVIRTGLTERGHLRHQVFTYLESPEKPVGSESGPS